MNIYAITSRRDNSMVFTKQDYEGAITTLELAMQQLTPDGEQCIVCGCAGHQAWECALNPLRALCLKNTYLCYCCGKRFDAETAREHFGEAEKDPPQCVKRLREELRIHAAFVYTHAILATPTGELRNLLTEYNILRLQTLRETMKGAEDGPAKEERNE